MKSLACSLRKIPFVLLMLSCAYSSLGDELVSDARPNFYRYQANFSVGANVWQAAGILMGGQFGVAPIENKPFYIGPEVNFTLFESSSLLETLLGAWYEFRIYGASRLSLSIGASAGAAFAGAGSPLNQTSVTGFLDACIVKEIDDLVTLRGQFRPGFLNGYFALQTNFNVSFHFP